MPQAKGGRPPKDKQSSMGETFKVRLSPAEKAAFRQAAALAGLGLSSWMRERLRRAAVRELEEAGQIAAFLRDDGVVQ